MIFRFSGTLLRFVDHLKEERLEAPDLRTGLTLLCERHPALRPVLYDGLGRLRDTHRMFVNRQPIKAREENPAMTGADCVEIVTAIVGG